MDPKISVIVPVYKVEPYLQKCVNSVLDQTFKDFELILVDDGSPDQCGEICDQYAQRDSRVKVIHKENSGVSSARNSGIDCAKGQYLAFVDPDDTVQANMYEMLLQSALIHDADMVICPIKSIDLKNGTTEISTIWEITNMPICRQQIENLIIPAILNKQYNSLLTCYNKLYKKSCFDTYEARFEERMHHGEDARLNIILLTKIKKLVFIDKPLYNYFKRDRDSLTRIFREDFYDYILDNKNFGSSLCYQYNVTQYLDLLIEDYILSSLNYMQSVVNSQIPIIKKYAILSRIMNDSEFTKHIGDYKSPSYYYHILKRICIHKEEKTFYKLVKTKTTVQHFLNKVG